MPLAPVEGIWLFAVKWDVGVASLCFFYANNVSVAAQISVGVTWRATSAPVTRGEGLAAEAPFWSAFLGEFADASCSGSGGGAETGFQFETGELTADGFFAEMGYERNGVFLE